MDKMTEMSLFVDVSRSESFSAAARHLRLSPSSISKIITRLEKRLGTRLFNRTTRTLHLTEAGDTFFEQCIEILDKVEHAENLIANEAQVPKGVVTINCSPGFAKYQLLSKIPVFLAQHPELELNIQINGEQVDLIKSDVDLAIRLGKLRDSNLIARKLGESKRVVCASPAYLKKHGEPISPIDLKKHNCLSISTNVSFNHWSFTVGRQKRSISVNGNLITDNVDLLKDLALKGVGIIRLSEFMIGDDLRKGRLIPLLEQYNSEIQQIHLVYPHRHQLPLKTKIFIEFLLDTFKDIDL